MADKPHYSVDLAQARKLIANEASDEKAKKGETQRYKDLLWIVGEICFLMDGETIHAS